MHKFVLITPTAVKIPNRSGTTSSVFRGASTSTGCDHAFGDTTSMLMKKAPSTIHLLTQVDLLILRSTGVPALIVLSFALP